MARIDEILAYAKESDIATIVTDGGIRTTYANAAFTKLSGYPEKDLVGKKPGDLLRGRNSCEYSRQCFHEGLRDLIPFEVKVKNYRKGSGEEYIAGIYVLPVRTEENPDESYYIALERELESPEEEILSDTHFSRALSTVVDLVTGFSE